MRYWSKGFFTKRYWTRSYWTEPKAAPADDGGGSAVSGLDFEAIDLAATRTS